jgi:hypothetical protein
VRWGCGVGAGDLLVPQQLLLLPVAGSVLLAAARALFAPAPWLVL